MEQDIKVAYICLVDIVGYSKQLASDQLSLVERLQEVVQKALSTIRVQEADFLAIPTGDGVALCFWDKPESAIVFALEFTRLLHSYNKRMLPEYRMETRIGIHFGPVMQVVDLSGHRNAIGHGINMATRVMSLGAPNQILASEVVYQLFADHELYRSLFRYVGSCQIKHGIIINVYNIFGEWKETFIGNQEPPITVTKVTEPPKEPLRRYAFIIMATSPDDPLLVDVHNYIKDVCSRKGIMAERVDEIEHTGKITDRIVDCIRRADIVIADLTHERPNVYYEIGLAHGQKSDVILTAHQGTKLHFDISGFNVIFYRNITELSERLEKRIVAILGE